MRAHWNRGIVRLFIVAILLLTFSIVSSCNEKDNPASSTPTTPVRGDGWTFTKISGDLQTARTYDTLSQRMVVCLKDKQNNPIVWEPILFTVTQGFGQVVAKLSPSDINEVSTITDWSGNASVNFRFYADTSHAAILVNATVDSFPSLIQTFTIYPPH